MRLVNSPPAVRPDRKSLGRHPWCWSARHSGHSPHACALPGGFI